MLNEVPEKEREKKLTEGGLDIDGVVNIKLVHRKGNAVIRRHLESLPLETFDSVSCTVFCMDLSVSHTHTQMHIYLFIVLIVGFWFRVNF